MPKRNQDACVSETLRPRWVYSKTGIGSVKEKATTMEQGSTSKMRCAVQQYLLIIVLAVCLSAPQAWAIGTPAGTAITNQATATYTVGTTELTVPSNPVTIRVVELLSISTVWQDAANVAVRPGDLDQILTFLVTNTGTPKLGASS